MYKLIGINTNHTYAEGETPETLHQWMQKKYPSKNEVGSGFGMREVSTKQVLPEPMWISKGGE